MWRQQPQGIMSHVAPPGFCKLTQRVGCGMRTYERALLRNLELGGDPQRPLRKNALSRLHPQRNLGRESAPGGQRTVVWVGNVSQPLPNANWGNLQSRPQLASQFPYPSAVDCKISADTTESDGLASSRAGTPADEP